MRRVVSLSSLAILAASASPTWPCSEGGTAAIWFFTMHPDLPLQPYARGRLGILNPSLAPSYLVVAYLYMQGRALTESEQQSVLDLWSRRIGRQLARGEEPGEFDALLAVKGWQAARDEAGAPSLSEPIDPWRTAADYASYLNCPAAAFDTAAATLRERAHEHGAGSPRVRAWLAAQDQVFANCGEARARVVPPPAAPEEDGLAKADRAYQIAAALFYAGDFQAAEEAFRHIGLDAASPWRKWGPYLAARALVRQATLSSSPPSADLLSHARAELDELLKSGPADDVLRAARGLRDLVSFRLDPLEHAHELAARMAEPEATDTLGHRIDDFTLALLAARRWPARDAPAIDWSAGGGDDLTHWVTTFHVPDSWGAVDDRLTVALERWRSTRSLPWLVAVLSWIGPDHPEVGLLLEAARAVPLDSPAGTTVAYHRLRLMLAKGERAPARAFLDRLLREDVEARGASARNRFLDLRLQLATDLQDLRAHLPRALVAWGYMYAGELPDAGRVEAGPAVGTSPLGARLLSGLPLSDLRHLALETDEDTSTLRPEIAHAAWAKAFVLEDEATLDALEERYPGLASGPEARSRALSRLVHWIKSLHPPWVIPDGPQQSLERWEPFASPVFDTGWWCDASRISTGAETPAYLEAWAAERARAEWAVVAAAGSGPEFAARRAVRLARESPREPAAPEALHLAVASTRWACSGGAVGDASRSAFRLLHQQYAQTSWARKTRYWYAGRW
jgi:hypothetical protein